MIRIALLLPLLLALVTRSATAEPNPQPQLTDNQIQDLTELAEATAIFFETNGELDSGAFFSRLEELFLARTLAGLPDPLAVLWNETLGHLKATNTALAAWADGGDIFESESTLQAQANHHLDLFATKLGAFWSAAGDLGYPLNPMKPPSEPTTSPTTP